MPQTYLRDGMTMIEVAPHQFVNERSAVALNLAAPVPPEPKPARQRKRGLDLADPAQLDRAVRGMLAGEDLS